jgi:hypothetical protein
MRLALLASAAGLVLVAACGDAPIAERLTAPAARPSLAVAGSSYAAHPDTATIQPGAVLTFTVTLDGTPLTATQFAALDWASSNRAAAKFLAPGRLTAIASRRHHRARRGRLVRRDRDGDGHGRGHRHHPAHVHAHRHRDAGSRAAAATGAAIRAQTALDQARPGDEIVLDPAATFVGNFTLPKKTGSGWIIVRSGAPAGSLPAEGQRVTPRHAGAMPKLLSASVAAPAWRRPCGRRRARTTGG